MAETCPNCGTVSCTLSVSHIAPYASGDYGKEDGQYCQECGHIQWMSGKSETPSRSQPVEVLELPNQAGWWWWKDLRDDWYLTRIDDRFDRWKKGCQYVRAIPPIVAKPKDADAEMLRNFAKYVGDGSAIYGLSGAVARRIAERLESEGKQ